MIIEETIVQLFEESKSSILESLRSQLIAKEYPKEWIDDIFCNIVITFSPTTSTVVHLSKITSNWQKEKTPMQVEEQEKKDTVAKILNDREGEGLRELLREKLLIEGHSDEWIDDVFGQFRIMVSSTIVPLSTTTKVTEISYTKAPINYGEKDNTKYNIFGLINLSKGKFVHAVIKHYVQQYPMTYNDYVHVFNQKGNRATIKLLAEVTDPIRYLMQQEYHLLSVDGKLFVVSTQWTKTNIQFIEEFALQQGYSFTTT